MTIIKQNFQGRVEFKMDVGQVMREVNVEQLVQLQTSLEREIETKKEELRQMVGQRYRDVLEASNAVKRLTEISDNLVCELREMHRLSSMVFEKKPSADTESIEQLTLVRTEGDVIHHTSLHQQRAVQDFVLLNAFLSQVCSTGDDVADVFCLLLADAFYRKFSSKAVFRDNNVDEFSRLTKNLFDRLIVTKLELADNITEKLGVETDWTEIAGGLAALALLKQMSVEALLEIYLVARLDHIFLNLKSSSSTSLIGIIRMMRDTMQIVEDVFGPGEAILSALRTVTMPEWCPESVKLIIDDQLCDYEKVFRNELCKINGNYASYTIEPIPLATVQVKCDAWIKQMCSVAADRVRAMSEHFELTEQIVEFVVAINQLFKSEWSSVVVSNNSIYHNLFGDAIVRRFGVLLDGELRHLEHSFLERFPFCQCNPHPLFQKRAVKFDALLASGVSQELNSLVQKMFDGMREILTNVGKYVSIGCEANIEQLRDMFADSVLQLVDRFLAHFHIPTSNSDSEFSLKFLVDTPSILKNVTAKTMCDKNAEDAKDKAHWLASFRLFLAFVQHEPSMFCLCMNRDARRISRCNKALHYATEFSLCNFMSHVIDECVKASQLSVMVKICSSEAQWMDLVEEFEHVEVEGAGRVDVPNQLSRYYFQFLYSICRQINGESVGHLFTKNVTYFISKKLGAIFSRNLEQCADVSAPAHRICAQLLFDSRVLFLMFLSPEFVEVAQRFEAKMDAVERKLLDEPLGRSAKLFAQRTSIIFGQLLAESSLTASAKDRTAMRQGHSALVDITPKIADIRRLALIPRLSKLRLEEEGRPRKGGKQRDKLGGGKMSHVSSASLVASNLNQSTITAAQMAAGLTEKIPSAASFSSFYDKISTGWFKN